MGKNLTNDANQAGKTITKQLREHAGAMSGLREELGSLVDDFNDKHKEWIEAELDAMQKVWEMTTYQGDFHDDVSLENIIRVDPNIDIGGERREVMYIDKQRAAHGIYAVYTKGGGRIWIGETPAEAP